MNTNPRKAAIVGCGFVGASIAFRFLQQGLFSHLVLLDANQAKAEGEAMDLSDGLPYGASMEITAGTYDDLADCGLVVITAGVNQKPGETRLELIGRNAAILKSIIGEITARPFGGILLIVSNPVDVLTYAAWKISGYPRERVIGSGTVLDTARLRHALSEFLGFADSNIHAYIMGEHGDSSFVPWIHSYIGCKSLLEYLDENDISLMELQNIYIDVRDKAYKIIDLKRATYYGIGYALKRIVDAVLNNEHCILPVSSYQNGEYDRTGLFIGTPTVIGSRGVERVMSLPLNENDQARFNKSFDTLEATIRENLGDIIDLD